MKKVLFVCSGNVGRSQMAEGFYNYFTNSEDAFSVGVDPKTPAKYPKIPDFICEVMKEEGIDVSEKNVKLITRDFVEEADFIFVMCGMGECPGFLLESDKVVYWNVEDPYGLGIDGARVVRDEIRVKVLSII